MNKPTFTLGQQVTNEEPTMGLKLNAIIYKIMEAKSAPDGFAYETLGTWSVLDAQRAAWTLDKKGNIKGNKRPTLRQLWSSHLSAV